MEEVFFQKKSTMGRDLGTVSHFFLTDRDSRKVLPRYACPMKAPVKENEEKTIPDTRSEGCIVLCPDGLLPQGSVFACMLALSLAASDISVGLIETTTRLPHTFFLSGGYENLNALFWEPGLDSPDFLNVVSRFRKTCDFLLINVAASALLKATGFAGLMRKYLVPTATRPRDLLSTYGAIKGISKRWGKAEIELIVIKQRATDNVAGAVAALEKMAHRFLTCSIRFVGSVALLENIAAFRTLSLVPAPHVLPNADAAAVKEIARHLIISSNLREKRKQHDERQNQFSSFEGDAVQSS